MAGHDLAASVAESYRRFAAEAAGRSPDYEALALFVAGGERIVVLLTEVAPEKRQPNLLFAAARALLGRFAERASLRRLVDERGEELAAVMRDRRTQTNKAARCALLLPALAMLEEPLALIEVGASAGLTLHADRYDYDYDRYRLSGGEPGAPVLRCRPIGPVPMPRRLPTVAWRMGIDLNPLDVADPGDVEWLSCLLWPGGSERAERFEAAVALARRHPFPILRGDLLEALPAAAAEAPAGASLVVYHTAVLAYVDAAKRRAFAAAVRDLGAVWLSNEGPGVIEGVGGQDDVDSGGFLLVRDGEVLLARTDPHGARLEWREGLQR